jgi:hypothetical protein
MKTTPETGVAAAILSTGFVLAAEQAPSLTAIQSARLKLRPLIRELAPPADDYGRRLHVIQRSR